MYLDNVSIPMRIYQTDSGLPGDAPSRLQFANPTFTNWMGTTSGSTSMRDPLRFVHVQANGDEQSSTSSVVPPPRAQEWCFKTSPSQS
ncbi:uncharacterized protein FIBRA_07871 [Fibroporia radiculosa]|uniref:Uncharacterized protein n=1 Tax=Fibroporia radiculosa TaxID=599839 RepID=J4I1J8_9APHY|nr:uncharacterized protein FIBRA_07871 [Fibroporia radiculosa]CCM05642.1 predicted protein [Fibroporia radiculosa]